MKIATIRTVVAGMLIATGLLAGCGSDSGTTASPASAPAATGMSAAPPVQLNPVDLIRKAGGDPSPGATVGSSDIQGNRWAEGEIGPDVRGAREGIRVYVWTGTPWPTKPSNDSTWHISGPGFEVDLTGYIESQTGSTVFPVPPEKVAASLGGRVVPRG